MLERIFSELGPWNWLVLGFVLLTLEIILPGVFLVWIGLAALAVGVLSIAIWEFSLWIWQVQILVFLVFSLLSAWLGYRFVRRDESPSDQPLLNQRARQLVGRTGTLDEAIRDGRGRLKLGDTWWPVNGPDAAPGTKVRVVAATDGDLVVEPV
ncbi:NfeD family protein [Aquibium oceanicum]|uniref:NfeD-like C-terminal domain-containing protein n=1 Tax=Aquibium oceanicum TaxID=1670800 RepID=A0A1L3SWJ2_9HYPH|nr:NfeD family protein [Aquibium oceanicum]APH73714.1 hypothetical protein BSQ44_21760 [Aquibium oceanicum]